MSKTSARFGFSHTAGEMLSVVALAFLVPVGVKGQAVPPVFDVHIHALAAGSQGPPPQAICAPMDVLPAARDGRSVRSPMGDEPPCETPLWSPTSDEAVKTQTLEALRKQNVFGVLSGSPSRVADWSTDEPGRFLKGLGFRVGMGISPDSLRQLHAAGRVEVLAEVTNQYLGLGPAAPEMAPYWALAEELDLPVGIHIGPGPPGVAYYGAPRYRARLHSPLELEEVLLKHPGLRVYVMHAGYPMLDDLLALMFAHPQVYAGLGVIVNALPRAGFYQFLEAIVDAGFGRRIMFGSDQMVWPEMIERGISAIREAPFLSDQQKRDILYHNAARFFAFSDETIRRHHGG